MFLRKGHEKLKRVIREWADDQAYWLSEGRAWCRKPLTDLDRLCLMTLLSTSDEDLTKWLAHIPGEVAIVKVAGGWDQQRQVVFAAKDGVNTTAWEHIVFSMVYKPQPRSAWERLADGATPVCEIRPRSSQATVGTVPEASDLPVVPALGVALHRPGRKADDDRSTDNP